MDCLTEKILSSYLDEGLLDKERKKIEGHIFTCERCLDLLLVAYEAQSTKQKCPSWLKDRIKSRLGMKVHKKKKTELMWLLGAIVLFMLSFVFKRYFLQFLMASAIIGFKWVMEGEGAKRVVMIFRGMHKEEKNFERKSPPPVSNITGGDKYGEGE